MGRLAWDDRLYVTAFDKSAAKLELIALDRNTGKSLWRRQAPMTELAQVHDISSPATSTPVTDGNYIFVYFGSYGLLAYDQDGRAAWQFPLPVAKSPFGSGTSPVLAGDVVILQRDYPPSPELMAISRQDGKLRWKVALPLLKRPGPNTAHSTPALWKDQIVLHRPGELSGYSGEDGSRQWWVNLTTTGTSTPLATPDALYVNAFSMIGEPEAIPEPIAFTALIEKYDTNKDGKLSQEELPENDVFLRPFAHRGL